MEYLFYALFLVIGWVLAKLDGYKRMKYLVNHAYQRGAYDLVMLAKEEKEKSTATVGFNINRPTMNRKDNGND